jgi:hypothetical protein
MADKIGSRWQDRILAVEPLANNAGPTPLVLEKWWMKNGRQSTIASEEPARRTPGKQ